jgi:hypothetical protein
LNLLVKLREMRLSMAGYIVCELQLTDRNKETAADFAIDRALTPFSLKIPEIHAATSLPYLDDEVAKG